MRPRCIKASCPTRGSAKRERCVESQEIPSAYVRLFTGHTASDRLWHATTYAHANAVSRAYGRPNTYTHCGYHNTGSVYWQQLHVFQQSTRDVC